jgi:SagB-type dehydrogenase family enzyme
MKIDWSTGTDERLLPTAESGLAYLYHENSKLAEALAREQAAQFAVSPFELFLTSRGFHQFRDAPSVELPASTPPDAGLADTITRRRSRRELHVPLGLESLAGVLRLALAPTALAANDAAGVTQALRAWPSAGGLYPLDAYVVARDVQGLEPGVYHHNAIIDRLESIPTRPVADILRDGFFWQEFATTASAAVLFVGVLERAMSKYGERGYRLMLLDAGHAAQNVLLAAEGYELPAVAVGGFCDDRLAADLSLDGVAEAVVHAVLLGGHDD